ncbi:hypothetical protein KTE26_16300 [Ralstonia mannitolilytica]|uniref:DUF6911 family protein n=1 Tax=Ralstonia mannitolilytica TaxID=105219 RepID=UPI000CEEB84D|nr:hypothetical protein [Ralstonia mannitolilytica]MBU9579995.1 hypothetical protein [Ralstonia mannitolilytica]
MSQRVSRNITSWSIGLGRGQRCGRKNNAAWSDVEKILREAQEESGIVTVDIVGGPEIGPQSLQLKTEKGRSVIMLGVDTGEDYIVRSYSRASTESGMAEILGDLWDEKSVCTDSGVIARAFNEFLETGDVSKELLT